MKMNSILFLIIGSACVGFSFAEVSMIPQKFSGWLLQTFNLGKKVKGYQFVKVPYRLKPFDCGYCLSFWVGLLSTYNLGHGLINAIMIGFASSIVAVILKKYL
jgi:hypothetical protein